MHNTSEYFPSTVFLIELLSLTPKDGLNIWRNEFKNNRKNPIGTKTKAEKLNKVR